MTQLRYIEKGVTSVLDIGIDWSAWLKSDTISASEWTADPAITLTRKQTTGTVTACYVSGGVFGVVYRVVNKITTVDGKVDSRYITITIQDSSV